MDTPTFPFDQWQHVSVTSSSTWVLPDGCRDLIWHALPGQRPVWFVTSLADSSYAVPSTLGEAYWGFRMPPGVQLDEVRLMQILRSPRYAQADAVAPILEDCMRVDGRVTQTLQALARHRSVAAAARDLGVSERTLQRVVHAATGRSPVYWRQLARVRRAAQALVHAPSLADCAADHGYTDQAHMSHEFQRWLCHSPGAVMASPTLQASLAASGY